MAETFPPTKPPTGEEPDRAAQDHATAKREPAEDCREPLWRDALGECLRSLRHERGEKLADTASRAGISPQYLSEMERGVKDPSSEMIAAACGALDVTLTDLAIAVAERTRASQITALAAIGARAAYALAA
ncbi:helix-turn-helix domain-containing protein [Glycomyces arizonensis]|uniref:helix-turn-helix domain-containing protein n=1 Tax=Glycomyces arizonensis TaxID=256035 RepID=UPI0004004A52|nr:helix-turn-helix transcriptional regulator [Glycomyces arizonensis]